ncbi:MAG: Gfo/Idh/MocA family oxidoreductase [Verrucomicrobiota bacterium]|nr:Gfo/Idh/MocA family oxidoreductase [Verrucomicrobiota bacterium]
MHSNRGQGISRRYFFGASASAALMVAMGGCASAPRRISKTEKLNIGIVGSGGRGGNNLEGVSSENIVALCDVDEVTGAGAFKKYPNAKRYRDFRVMLEREKGLDAIVVSTPDHTHAVAAIAGLRAGKHVYCEKPLGHSIWEVRKMREAAERSGLVTQMGQQGHATEGTRRAVEVIRSGAIGDVTELHVWTDRPAGWWPQGEERPTDRHEVPAHLDWDLWLGPAAYRPYHPIYVPFKWRGRWDFGTGAIGDMGVHNLDPAFWALELGEPVSAEVIASDRITEDCPPLWSIIQVNFPARGNRSAVKMVFYDGKKVPPADLFMGEQISDNGSLIIGNKGTIYTRTWHGGMSEADMFLLLPKKEFIGYVPPMPTIPRTQGHHEEFILACKGGPRTQSDFVYASRLTEALLVGQLALRTGQKISWDEKRMRANGSDKLNHLIRPEFRKGWEI